MDAREEAISTSVSSRAPAAGSDALLALLLALAVAAAGCFLVPEPTSKTARVELEGADGAEVRLVTSMRFERASTGPPNSVQLLDADTLRVRLPFARDYDISQEQRFFAQATRIETAADDASAQPATTLRMRAFIDGQGRYDKELALEDSTALQFVFVYIRLAAMAGGGEDLLLRFSPERGRRSR